jgi:hypothetical protein
MAKRLLLAVFLGLSSAAWPWPLADLFKDQPAPAKEDSISKSANPVVLKSETRISPQLEVFPVGKTLEFVVEVSWQGALGDATAKPPARPSLENLEWVGMTQTQRARPETGGASVVFTMTLRPVKEGTARIGPAEIAVVSRSGAAISSISVEGAEFAVGRPARQWGKIGGFLGAGLAAVAILALAAFGVRRARAKKIAPARGPSAFEQLRERLGELDKHLVEGDESAFYGAARGLLWQGICEARLATSRAIPTAGEFAEWFGCQGETVEGEIGPCRGIFEQAERAMFGGWRPTGDETRAAQKDLRAVLQRLEDRASRLENSENGTKENRRS